MEFEPREHIVLVPEALRVIEEAEALTGKKVIIRGDPTIGPNARAMYIVQRPQSPEHIILYDPVQMHHLSHLVAHEVGHIRHYAAVPPEQRLVPVIGKVHRGLALSQISQELSNDAPLGHALRANVRTWMRAVISRLVDFPADVMIERWIYAQYPPLRPAQRESLADQVNLLRSPSTEDARRSIPSLIWKSARALDHAYFLLVSEFIEPPDTIHPKQDALSQDTGGELAMAFQRRAPTDLVGSRDVTRLWADRLGLEGWFGWKTPDELSSSSQVPLFPKSRTRLSNLNSARRRAWAIFRCPRCSAS